MLVCLGLGLGVANTALTLISALRFLPGTDANQRRFLLALVSQLVLTVITAIAFAVLFWPDGVGVIAGVAVFQVLLIAVSALRRTPTSRAPAPDEQPA